MRAQSATGSGLSSKRHKPAIALTRSYAPETEEGGISIEAAACGFWQIPAPNLQTSSGAHPAPKQGLAHVGLSQAERCRKTAAMCSIAAS
jgi:hypothetical protein